MPYVGRKRKASAKMPHMRGKKREGLASTLCMEGKTKSFRSTPWKARRRESFPKHAYAGAKGGRVLASTPNMGDKRQFQQAHHVCPGKKRAFTWLTWQPIDHAIAWLQSRDHVIVDRSHPRYRPSYVVCAEKRRHWTCLVIDHVILWPLTPLSKSCYNGVIPPLGRTRLCEVAVLWRSLKV